MLDTLDLVVAALFMVEAALKIVGQGPKRYFCNGWNLLDFFIVLSSTVMLWVSAAKSLRALRALRALRPLRVISRHPGMKLVVNSVFRSLPDVLNL